MKPINLKIKKSTEEDYKDIVQDALVLTLTLWDGDNFLTETNESDKSQSGKL